MGPHGCPRSLNRSARPPCELTRVTSFVQCLRSWPGASNRAEAAAAARAQVPTVAQAPTTVAVRCRGCPPFAWGPEEEALWEATRVSEAEIAAMIDAVVEDGWGAWVG